MAANAIKDKIDFCSPLIFNVTVEKELPIMTLIKSARAITAIDEKIIQFESLNIKNAKIMNDICV